MEIFSIAERWVSNNYPNATQEEKERLATAFIGGMSEMQRKMQKTSDCVFGRTYEERVRVCKFCSAACGARVE